MTEINKRKITEEKTNNQLQRKYGNRYYIEHDYADNSFLVLDKRSDRFAIGTLR